MGLDVDQLDSEALGAFAARAEEGPLVMLNLLAFDPDGGAELYASYAEQTAPLLAEAGGRMLAAYRPGATLIGSEHWDLVALIEYPSRRAFMEMVSSEPYQAITHLRTEALTRAALVPMDPADGALGG